MLVGSAQFGAEPIRIRPVHGRSSILLWLLDQREPSAAGHGSRRALLALHPARETPLRRARGVLVSVCTASLFGLPVLEQVAARGRRRVPEPPPESLARSSTRAKAC